MRAAPLVSLTLGLLQPAITSFPPAIVPHPAPCQTLGISASTFGAGLAADDLILVAYFTTL
jgi:hypothetical protein